MKTAWIQFGNSIHVRPANWLERQKEYDFSQTVSLERLRDLFKNLRLSEFNLVSVNSVNKRFNCIDDIATLIYKKIVIKDLLL